MMASSSAITTRVDVFTKRRSGGWSGLRGQLVGHPIEEGVLLAEQLGQGGFEGLAMPGHRLGVPAGLTGLSVAQRGLGDECPEAGLLALLLEETLLLDCNGELGADPLEPLGDVEETPLQNRPGHSDQSTRCGASQTPLPPWPSTAGRRRGTRRGSRPSPGSP